MRTLNQDGFCLVLKKESVSLNQGEPWRSHAVNPPESEPVIHLGSWRGVPLLAVWGEGWWSYPWAKLREVFTVLDEELWRYVVKGLTLLHWHRTNRFCGVCGGVMKEHPEENALRCTACGHTTWPRISPAVIVLVTHQDKVLLGHNRRMEEGVFSLLAGYVEPGESLEEAVHREVREESGVEIKNLRYLASQPWPFPDSLMFGFHAEWKSGEPRPDGKEILDVRWFELNNLPRLPGPGSMARKLLEWWIQLNSESK